MLVRQPHHLMVNKSTRPGLASSGTTAASCRSSDSSYRLRSSSVSSDKIAFSIGSRHSRLCGFATHPLLAALHPIHPFVYPPYNYDSTSRRVYNRLGMVSGCFCEGIRGSNSGAMGFVAVSGSESNTRASRPRRGIPRRSNKLSHQFRINMLLRSTNPG